MDIEEEIIKKIDEAINNSVEKSMGVLVKILDKVLIALIITIFLFFTTNAIWIYEWNQYDYELYEVEQQVDGTNGVNSFNTGEMGNIECGKE